MFRNKYLLYRLPLDHCLIIDVDIDDGILTKKHHLINKCYYEILLLVGACLQVKSVKTIIKLTFAGCHNVLILGCTYYLPLLQLHLF